MRSNVFPDPLEGALVTYLRRDQPEDDDIRGLGIFICRIIFSYRYFLDQIPNSIRICRVSYYFSLLDP